jgi:hypothetical protein
MTRTYRASRRLSRLLVRWVRPSRQRARRHRACGRDGPRWRPLNGVRAGLCHDTYSTGVEHDDINAVLVARINGPPSRARSWRHPGGALLERGTARAGWPRCALERRSQGSGHETSPARCLGSRRAAERLLAGMRSRARRLWQRDASPWGGRRGALAGLVRHRRAQLPTSAPCARGRARGVRHVLLLGMGGSSLAPGLARDWDDPASRAAGPRSDGPCRSRTWAGASIREVFVVASSR